MNGVEVFVLVAIVGGGIMWLVLVWHGAAYDDASQAINIIGVEIPATTTNQTVTVGVYCEDGPVAGTANATWTWDSPAAFALDGDGGTINLTSNGTTNVSRELFGVGSGTLADVGGQTFGLRAMVDNVNQSGSLMVHTARPANCVSFAGGAAEVADQLIQEELDDCVQAAIDAYDRRPNHKALAARVEACG